MSDTQRSGAGTIVIVGVIAALVAAGTVIWTSGVFGTQTLAPTPADQNQPAPEIVPATAIAARLAPIVEAARASSAKAQTAARDADAVAVAADQVAAAAQDQAEKGKSAAADAEQAATKACKTPGKDQVCADAPDGSHYAGTQSCKGAQGCGPEGYGVLTDKAHGWQSAGRWRDWELVLGCDTANGTLTYCGAEAKSAWNGSGISYNENDAAISAEWSMGAGKSPMRLDYPTGSHMRGEMSNYELNGYGVYDRADGRVLQGVWQAGKLTSGVATYVKSGTKVSGDFVDGNAALGAITYADGRVFVGRIEDGPAVSEALPAEGVIYSPAGAIIQQGAWKDGRFSAP